MKLEIGDNMIALQRIFITTNLIPIATKLVVTED